MLTGLTSVTFRQLNAQEIIGLALEAGLDGIEWGGDVHVPPASPALAAGIREKCREKGLQVLSYGSYYRGGPLEEFRGVLESAKALGAPVIRIWAGSASPQETDGETFEALAANIRRAADLAAEEGIAIAFEYHRRTMTQTKEGALRLLEAALAKNVYTYWQPNPDVSFEEQLAEIDAVAPRLSHLHVFAWEAGNLRYPLAHSAEKWRAYFAHAAKAPGERAASLEFVKDDSPQQFLEDARTLKEILAR